MGGRSEEERGFAALVEDVRHDVKVIAEHQRGLIQKVHCVAQESEERDSELDGKVNLYARTIVRKISSIDGRVSSIDRKVDDIGAAVLELSVKMDAGFTSLLKEFHLLGNRLDAHERTHLR